MVVQIASKWVEVVGFPRIFIEGGVGMFNGFCGLFQHNLDDKNRFKIPANFREDVGTKVYLIRSPYAERCIFLYSEEGWNELYLQFNKGEEYNHATLRKQRKILSGVVCGEVDKTGRLTLNAALKEYAGIVDSVQLVGNNKHIEIWSPEEWLGETDFFEEASTDDLNINF